jgi:hypothetical protein
VNKTQGGAGSRSGLRRLRVKLQSIRCAVALVAVAAGAVPALAHHSFAMYDQTQTLTLTGICTRFIAQANHAELHLFVIGPDGRLLKDSDGKNVD